MMKENLVSIIIPCFNGEKYLNDTLSSVLWQTYTNWECILVDDGSTDNTYSLYLQFMQRDKRFKYFKKNQEGPSAARNFGVLKSSGDFIQFLDADDIILPERLELCLKEFEKNPSIDAVYTDYITFQARQGYSKILPARMPSSDTIKSLLFENNLTFAIIIHSLLFRAHAVKQNPFDLLLHSYGEDVECWLRMALNGARFHYYDKVLSIYRYTQNSLGSDEVQLYQAKLSILQKYSTHPKCVGYKIEFHNTLLYYHQRLVIAYFM
ncbi:MAG: glycosyltransferase family 2 protein, partial [Bacteroidetes bacterium]|nr:glycosyltransferase family 2 protein [Bacteroidota bacterium]